MGVIFFDNVGFQSWCMRMRMLEIRTEIKGRKEAILIQERVESVR